MLYLSQILIAHKEIETFADLVPALRDHARMGERFFSMDVKPPFSDTPDDWEDRLESAFSGRLP